MKVVQESAEHHFLTLLEKIKQDAGGWEGFHIALSRKLSHDKVIEKPEHIKGHLFKLRKEAEGIVSDLGSQAEAIASGTAYLFSDCDIIFLFRPDSAGEMKSISALCKSMTEKIGEKLCGRHDLSKEIYNYQKIADKKFLGTHRMKAYESLSDINRIQSIALRRQRREDPLVQIVEDDRFTASYASNILNKECEVVLSKTGEEAISDYIEHAPDIVFLDIHLPGLTGHETLRAIRKADSDGFIVMLSVDTAKTNVVNASKGGASGFLKKPFSKERILHIVQQSPFVKDRKTGKP